VFSNNRASAAYDRAESDDELYRKHIGSRVTWTSPFEQGYNNYDISYTKGTPIDVDDGPKPTNSPTSTPANTPSPPATSDNGSKPESDGFDWRIVVIVLAIVIALLVAALIFYLPKREAKHIEEDLNDFTVV